jgi:hypothetical protein
MAQYICHHTGMTTVALLVPVVLSLAVLGAHFLRYGNWIGVIGALVIIALLFVRRPWVARLLQAVLVLGALEWARTLYVLVAVRAAHDLPHLRMSVILGVVALVSFCSALLFQVPALKLRYGLEGRP